MILDPPIMPRVEGQADWAEASCLFGDNPEVYFEDLRGTLVGSRKHRHVNNRIDDIWRELDWRKNTLGAHYPFKLFDDHFKRLGDWSKWLPYSYMLLLSINGFYKNEREKRETAKASSRPFLKFVSDGLKAYLPKSIMFDFPREGTVPKEIFPALEFVCEKIGENLHEKPSLRRKEKDAGVDLFVWHPIDSRSGKIILLVQCTVEENWFNSRTKIELERWVDIIRFAADPQKALAIPYVCHADWHAWSRSGGVIFDRLRLSRLFSKNKISLRQDILRFCALQIKTLHWYQ